MAIRSADYPHAGAWDQIEEEKKAREGGPFLAIRQSASIDEL
jgi:hypothetical protein